MNIDETQKRDVPKTFGCVLAGKQVPVGAPLATKSLHKYKDMSNNDKIQGHFPAQIQPFGIFYAAN